MLDIRPLCYNNSYIYHFMTVFDDDNIVIIIIIKMTTMIVITMITIK